MQAYIGDNLDSLAAGLTGLMAGSPPTSSSVASSASSATSECAGGHHAPSELRPRERELIADLTFATFNQDSTSLAVGTSRGYKLFSLGSGDGLECIHENSFEEVVLAERLFCSSLVALVTKSAPRKLRVCHFRKGTEICNYSFASSILAVRMNRQRLVVCLEGSMFIHGIRDMRVLHTIKETPPNKAGLCALSPSDDEGRCLLAYPGNSVVGEVHIFDAVNMSSRCSISAHASHLAALAFSPSGSRIATASEKGTVIRIFSALDGTRLCELRRGLKRTADIHYLSFSPCGSFLACSSNTETVHIFRTDESLEGSLDGPTSSGKVATSPPGSDSWMGYLVSASAPFLPQPVGDTLMQGRAFATVRHGRPGTRNAVALVRHKRHGLRLLIASADGFLYAYTLDMEEGGECALARQYQLVERRHGRPVPPGAASGASDSEDSDAREFSYADRVKNKENDEMTADSEKFHEMEAATEVPPQQCFLLDDDGEFPPMISGRR